jgi:hypothetical protein
MRLDLLKRTIPKRAAAIAVALIAAASVVTGREKPALEVVEAKPGPVEKAAAPDIDLGKLRRAEAAGAAQSDPFAPRNFAPPAQPAGAAPQGPQGAPPLPFAYAGKLTQDGRTEFFVTRGAELISIAAGAKIDAQYRVDSISEARIRFTYLPLKTRQSLELTEAGG